jgi:Tol biopolymer transport system component
VTVDNRGNFAAWSPDGQRIVFSGLTRQTLFEKSASGDPADHALLQSDYTVFPSDWSSDGKYVLFTRSSPGNDVWALPMEGERKAVPIVASPAADLHGHVSPDGRFLAFTSNGSGRSEVYVQAFPSSETPQRVSGDGGGYPRWSRKGNELYFRSLDGRLLAAPIRYHGDSAIPGEPRFVMRLIEPPGLHPYPYDVAPDGRVLALTPVSGSAASISLNVLVNWQAALGR